MSESTKNRCTCMCNNAKDGSCCAENFLPQNIIAFIDECKGKQHPESYLIAVLHMVQDHFGYLSEDAMDAVAYLLQIPAAKVSGVASFYNYFRLTPSAKYMISICMGTACYVKGGEDVLNKFREELGIEVGEVTADGRFGLEIARCLGACALAPVVKIGTKIHSALKPEQVPALLASYMDE